MGGTVKSLSDWECLKCGHKWVDESEIEPRFCPLCGEQMIVKAGDIARTIEKGLKRYAKT